jgi:hypothetical protein
MNPTRKIKVTLGRSTSLRQLTDVVLTNVSDGDKLVYDSAFNQFVATPDTLASDGSNGVLSAADYTRFDEHEQSRANPHEVTKAQVGLSNVDNTSDISKPISLATQTALNLKAPLASPALTGAPTAPTAGVDTNTTQVATTAFAKREADDAQAFAIQRANHTGVQAIATVTNLQSSLDLKAPLASPTFTGVPAAPTAAVDTNTTQVATTAFAKKEADDAQAFAIQRANHTGTQTASTISDFSAAVAATASVTANTAKITNATHTGDASGATVLTLATVNGSPGSFGSAASTLTATVNGKGLVTAMAAVASTPAWANVTSKPTTVDGYAITDGYRSVAVPASATATGSVRSIAYDDSYIYICVGTNVWKRAALATW